MTAKGKQWAERVLRLGEVREREDFQLRANGIDRTYLKRLTQALKEGEDLPAVRVAAIGNALYLVDGFHRLAAHEAAGRTTIKAEVARMSLDEARELARGANTKHGKNLSRADKRRLWEDYTGSGRHLEADGRPKSARAIVIELGHQVYSRETVRKLLKDMGLELNEGEDFKPWGGGGATSEADLAADLADDASTSLHHFGSLIPQLNPADRERLLGNARALVEALGRGEDVRPQLQMLANPLDI